MTPIDYLLLAGVALAGGYVVARLLTGLYRASHMDAGVERGNKRQTDVVPKHEFERVGKTGAPWHVRK